MAKRQEQKAQAAAADKVMSAEEARKQMDSNRAALHDLEVSREAMLEPFASELPEAKELLVVETKFFLAQASISFIEVGRRLIVLKEKTEHGEWYKILNELNIDPSTATRSMRVAHKFGSLKSMLHLDSTKLVALLDVPEEEIKRIEKTGTVLGMSVDAIDAMTTRQLKDKLREERRRNDKGTEQLRRKDEEIRLKDEKIKELKIGPKTDLEYLQQCQEVQIELAAVLARSRGLANRAKNDTQAMGVCGMIVAIEKEVTILAHDIQVAMDSSSMFTDADRAQHEQMVDGINFLAPSVIEFMMEATRKANDKEA